LQAAIHQFAQTAGAGIMDILPADALHVAGNLRLFQIKPLQRADGLDRFIRTYLDRFQLDRFFSCGAGLW